MVYQEYRSLTTARNDVLDITEQVSQVIAASGIQNGIVAVEAEAATVGIVRMQRNGDELRSDLTKEMRRLVPARITFQQEISPEYTAGNLKSAFFGNSVTSVVQGGRLLNGQNGMFLLEYDGPAARKYHVCVIGE